MELRVLRKEAVARVNSLSARGPDYVEHGVHQKIALIGRGRPNAEGLVSLLDEH